MFINVTISRHSVAKFTTSLLWLTLPHFVWTTKLSLNFRELLIEIIFSNFTFTSCKCSQSHITPPLESTAQVTNIKILMHPVYNNVRERCLLLSRPPGASITLYYI